MNTLHLCHEAQALIRQLYQQLIDQHIGGGEDDLNEVTASDVEDSVTRKKISLEKEKERLRHAKEREKHNADLRRKHEQRQKEAEKLKK